MPNFSIRSTKSELLDAPNIPKEALYQNLRELETINKLLGGHLATRIGLEKLLRDKTREYTIADFGCGGGDTLRFVYHWAQKNGLKLKLIGFDLLDDAISFSKEYTPESFGIEYRQANFYDIDSSEQFDVVISSLFTHHLYDDDLKSVLLKKRQQSRIGFIINDLHRHPLAYHSIKWLTAFLSKSHLVKNDAPLSVLKGFKSKEWAIILNECGIQNFNIQWIWAFRHLIIAKSE